MDVGTTLRNAREQRGLSIVQVSTTTKISTPLLHAIESNAFEKLPSGIFARGFIRSYAREVGLDPEEMVEQFLEQSGDTTAMGETQLSDAVLVDDMRPLDPNADSSSGRAMWGYTLIVAALLVAYVGSTRIGTGTSASAHPSASTAAAPATIAAEEPVSDTAPAPPAGEPEAVATTGDGILQIDIAPSGPCWVEAVVDGKPSLYRLMQAGERETLSGREIALKVGDPGVFVYDVNKQRGRTLGAANKPVTVTLNAESYSGFLESAVAGTQ
jgi:cytoskeletal protein RodZ